MGELIAYGHGEAGGVLTLAPREAAIGLAGAALPEPEGWSQPGQLCSGESQEACEKIKGTHPDLTAASCPTGFFCAAVGYEGAVFTTRSEGKAAAGERWQLERTPAGPSPLLGLSCGSPGFCVASDEEGNALTYGASGGNGYLWAETAPIEPEGTHEVRWIIHLSCSAEGYCLAVDSAGRAIRRLPGTAGWEKPVEIDPKQLLAAVSCSPPLFCVAVDDIGRAFTYTDQSVSQPGTWGPPQQIDSAAAGEPAPSREDPLPTAHLRNGNRSDRSGQAARQRSDRRNRKPVRIHRSRRSRRGRERHRSVGEGTPLAVQAVRRTGGAPGRADLRRSRRPPRPAARRAACRLAAAAAAVRARCGPPQTQTPRQREDAVPQALHPQGRPLSEGGTGPLRQDAVDGLRSRPLPAPAQADPAGAGGAEGRRAAEGEAHLHLQGKGATKPVVRRGTITVALASRYIRHRRRQTGRREGAPQAGRRPSSGTDRPQRRRAGGAKVSRRRPPKAPARSDRRSGSGGRAGGRGGTAPPPSRRRSPRSAWCRAAGGGRRRGRQPCRPHRPAAARSGRGAP